MGEPGATRIQLCGRLVVELNGRRVENALPGAKGRLLFAYLVLNRDRRLSRDELLTAVYGDEASPDQQPSLSVLLSKLRSVIGQELLAGRSEIELVLLRDAFIDVEAAREALHRAESHVAAGERAETWGPAGVAYHVARRLIELAPYRESGHRILMEALERRGNVAEALLAYDRLRVLLRDELGVAPSPAVQRVHKRLLGEETTTSA